MSALGPICRRTPTSRKPLWSLTRRPRIAPPKRDADLLAIPAKNQHALSAPRGKR